MSLHAYPRLHNAMWPGLVGKKSQGGEEADLSLDRMLELTAGAEVDGRKYDGIDYFLFLPHTDPDASEDDLRRIADKIAAHGFTVGSLVAPVWPGTVGDSAMGGEEARGKFVLAVEKACRIATIFNEHGVRDKGVIRIDTACSPAAWAEDQTGNTRRIVETFRRAAAVARDHGERLAAEAEICWAMLDTVRHTQELLEDVNSITNPTPEQMREPGRVGLQADLAHVYLLLFGYNAPEDALLQQGYSDEEFWVAYKTMTDALGPWTIDFHVGQNDGSVHGTGSHDKTGRHCPADDPNGKLDIVKCAGYWLAGAKERGIEHICWDGCMFPNELLETQATWNTILDVMIQVQDTQGWD